MRAVLVATGFLAALSTVGARAATVITSTQNDGEGAKTQTMYLDGDKLRMSGPGGDMLYRGDQGKVFVVDEDSHSYMEMSPEGMAKVKARMDAAMAQMKQQMASMPEAQRKQMEAAMAARGMPGMGQTQAAPPQITFQKGGASRKVGKWDCQPYTVISDGKPEADLCVAKLSDMGLTRDDLKPFIGLSEFMGKQMSGMGQQASPMASMNFDSLNKAVGYEGFPVESTYKAPMGPQEFKSTVQSVEHKDVPAASFDLPAGYTKHDMGGPGGPK
jgi:hypothetical protein